MGELELVYGDRVIIFPGERFVIGSARECAVRLEGEKVRPRHAEVLCERDGSWWVRDIAGSGTVRVDGSPTLEAQLHGGTFLTIGEVDLEVREVEHRHDGTMQTPSSSAVLDITAPPTSRPTRRPGPLEPGELIENRYRVIARIAQGGMGEVYQAEHIELHKPVAVKVMLPELSRDADFVARFKREAIASSRIGHQNIVDISDFGRTADGRFYFVMELLDGRTLSSHLRETGPFSSKRAVHVMLQAARALAAAHDQGIVHRDLKPENIMLLQRKGQPDFVKVLDFGIAKVNEGHGSAGGLTAIGMVVGTPQYMSPEQASGLPVDLRTDIYSLGLIFYELISGRPTFAAETPSVLMAMQMTAAPPPLAPGPIETPLPDTLEQLVFHMLAKRLHERPASMHDVVERLEAMQLAATATPPLTRRSGLVTRAAPLSRIEPLTLTPPASATIPPGGTSRDVPRVATPHKNRAPSLSIDLDTTDLGQGSSSFDAPVLVDEPPPAPKTSRLPLVLGGVVVLGIAVATAIVFYPRGAATVPITVTPPPPQPEVRQKPPEPNPDPRPPAAEKLALTFETSPTGADVYEDDVLLGTSPVILSREQSQVVTLRFELKGYKNLTRKVRFESGGRVVVIELEKDRRNTGPGPRPKGPHDEPYSNVKDLKSLPD